MVASVAVGAWLMNEAVISEAWPDTSRWAAIVSLRQLVTRLRAELVALGPELPPDGFTICARALADLETFLAPDVLAVFAPRGALAPAG